MPQVPDWTGVIGESVTELTQSRKGFAGCAGQNPPMSARLAVQRGTVNLDDPGIRGEGQGSLFTLRISVEGSAFVLVPEGHLDGEAGEVVASAFEAAQSDAEEVVIDLRSLTSSTSEGTARVDACERRGARLRA